jgi:hypothetical protein
MFPPPPPARPLREALAGRHHFEANRPWAAVVWETRLSWVITQDLVAEDSEESWVEDK